MPRVNPLLPVLTAAALCASAPLASAEVVFSGEAKMGLVFDGEDLKAVAGTRITAHAYGVTDGGLEYGIVLDMDQVNTKTFNRTRPRSSVYIQSGNHSLRIGNGVDNAIRSTIGTLPKVEF
ncbi:porin [Pseudorhodobacter sp. E13]|uniref:porin n=1 Tax=Pseudorhodobacter sp. E13 TaxID=2487931 RepID=UPI000F8D30D7|nr:porin [Pseudorhodobacter sp. E13]RUS59664.1 porin [Pseudorhodobacter sp. E13]